MDAGSIVHDFFKNNYLNKMDITFLCVFLVEEEVAPN